MKRACRLVLRMREIISSLHMMPLKTNNLNHMKLSGQLKFHTQEED
jgi:hypothetical protein